MKDGHPCLFEVRRAGSYGAVALKHLPWTLLTGAVLLAAFLLPLDKISVRTCVFLRLTGYPCPSCGWTRGFVGMADGEWATVIHDCPLTVVLYGLTVMIFAWNTAALVLGVNIERGAWLRLDDKRGWWLLAGIVLAVLANWFYRLGMGFK